MSRALQFLARNWIWWAPALLVAAIVAITLLFLYSGNATSPFEYPTR